MMEYTTHMLACSVGSGITSVEAVDLIHRKFSQSPQRRQLQPREIERAVERAYGGAVPIRRISKGCPPPKFAKITPRGVGISMPLPSVKPNQDLINEAVRATKWSGDIGRVATEWMNARQRASGVFDETGHGLLRIHNRFMTLSVKDWLVVMLDGHQVV